MGIHKSEVAISGSTFEGEHRAAHFPGIALSGVFSQDGGGSAENCRFVEFRERVPGGGGTHALRVLNELDGAAMVRMTVEGNTFIDNYGGVVLRGAATNQSITFTNNTLEYPWAPSGCHTLYAGRQTKRGCSN